MGPASGTLTGVIDKVKAVILNGAGKDDEALDRIICLVSPFFKKKDGEVHHKLRYARYPRLMVVGVLPKADAESESIFKTLVDRNALNIHPPAHAGGVVLSGQDMEEARKEIKSLLAAIEVIQ